MVSLIEQRNHSTGLCKYAFVPILRPGSVIEASISFAFDWNKKKSNTFSFRYFMNPSPGFGKNYSELLSQ